VKIFVLQGNVAAITVGVEDDGGEGDDVEPSSSGPYIAY
jgi:hypothetical protein